MDGAVGAGWRARIVVKTLKVAVYWDRRTLTGTL